MDDRVLHLDFETRGSLDLREVGTYRYARHRHTGIWCMGYAFDEEEPEVLGGFALSAPELVEDRRIFQHVKQGGTVIAHNAPFELEIWNAIMVRHSWPALRPEQTFCTMACSYAMGLPGSLENAALALGLAINKDTEGRALMLRMARPRRMEGDQPIWWDSEDKIKRLQAYCAQDVRVEREIHKRVRSLSDYERRVWLMDYEINKRGVLADVESAKAGIAIAERIKNDYGQELAKITGGAVSSVGAVGAIKDWCRTRGHDFDSLDKKSVVDALAIDGLDSQVARVLTIRQEAAKASTAKLAPMVELGAVDGRLRDTMQYHGANTGRWAGRKIQPHNFPRDVPSAGAVEEILALVRLGRPDSIELGYGPPMTVIAKCLRGFLMAPEGKLLCVGDFANVEGRGVAWFAGEQWKIDAFMAADAGTGPGIYELSYAKAFGVDVRTIKNPSPERQKGKTAELAFGYQGALGAWRKFDQTVPDEQVVEMKEAWRATHPNVVKLWYALERAAINAVKRPGEIFKAGAAGREVAYIVKGSFLWCRLQSGRLICYPYPKILEGQYGDELTYMTEPGPDKSSVRHDPNNSGKWARCATYGGSLLENIVQAFCRDLLVHCLLQVKDYVVLHVHDEIVIEVPADKGEAFRERMEQIMRSPPEWAKGFPLWAECKLMRRYGK